MQTIMDLYYDLCTDQTRLSIKDKPINLPCFGSGKNAPIEIWKDDFFPDIIQHQGLGSGSKCKLIYYGTPSDFALFKETFDTYEPKLKKDGIEFELEGKLTDISAVYQDKIKNLSIVLKRVEALFPDVERQEAFKKHEKAIAQYEEFVKDPEIQVAVVGAVKAGKSTLMNAILGDEIASTNVTPETATLTIFKASDKNYVKVFFYTADDWREIWDSASKHPESPFFKEYKKLDAESIKKTYLNHAPIDFFPESIAELKEKVKGHSSKTEPIHYFVKKLEIGLEKFGTDESPLPRELSFVDTPGLHDVVEYRANITKGYISRANAVIVCIYAGSLRSDEYSTIQRTFEIIGAEKENKEKVIVLGTQIDSRNKPVDDWKSQKAEWVTYLEDLYKNPKALETNIIGVSARIFSFLLKLRDGSEISDADVREISTFAGRNGIAVFPPSNPTLGQRLANMFSPFDERKVIMKNIDKLLDFTGIYQFITVMETGPLRNPEKVLAKDFELKYTHDVAKSVKDTVSDLKDHVEEQLQILGKTLEEKQAVIDEKQSEIDAIQAYRKQLDDAFKTMEKTVRSKVEQMKTQLKSDINKILGGA